MSFTPGPWWIYDSVNVMAEGMRCVASTHTRTSNMSDWEDVERENEANAALIAAAPDMYAALEAIEEWFASEDAGPTYPEGVTRDDGGEAIWRGWWQSNMELCARANLLRKAALAKARGEA